MNNLLLKTKPKSSAQGHYHGWMSQSAISTPVHPTTVRASTAPRSTVPALGKSPFFAAHEATQTTEQQRNGKEAYWSGGVNRRCAGGGGECGAPPDPEPLQRAFCPYTES